MLWLVVVFLLRLMPCPVILQCLLGPYSFYSSIRELIPNVELIAPSGLSGVINGAVLINWNYLVNATGNNERLIYSYLRSLLVRKVFMAIAGNDTNEAVKILSFLSTV